MKNQEHKCLNKVRKQLMKADKRLKYVRFDLSNIVSWEGNKIVAKGKTGQRVVIGIEYKKKNGEMAVREEKSFIGHDYCPYCGKKY